MWVCWVSYGRSKRCGGGLYSLLHPFHPRYTRDSKWYRFIHPTMLFPACRTWWKPKPNPDLPKLHLGIIPTPWHIPPFILGRNQTSASRIFFFFNCSLSHRHTPNPTPPPYLPPSLLPPQPNQTKLYRSHPGIYLTSYRRIKCFNFHRKLWWFTGVIKRLDVLCGFGVYQAYNGNYLWGVVGPNTCPR